MLLFGCETIGFCTVRIKICLLNCQIISFTDGSMHSWLAEQKKQKISEIKTGLDDADGLVLKKPIAVTY